MKLQTTIVIALAAAGLTVAATAVAQGEDPNASDDPFADDEPLFNESEDPFAEYDEDAQRADGALGDDGSGGEDDPDTGPGDDSNQAPGVGSIASLLAVGLAALAVRFR